MDMKPDPDMLVTAFGRGYAGTKVQPPSPEALTNSSSMVSGNRDPGSEPTIVRFVRRCAVKDLVLPYTNREFCAKFGSTTKILLCDNTLKSFNFVV
jgi:hypothetical protein